VYTNLVSEEVSDDVRLSCGRCVFLRILPAELGVVVEDDIGVIVDVDDVDDGVVGVAGKKMDKSRNVVIEAVEIAGIDGIFRDIFLQENRGVNRGVGSGGATGLSSGVTSAVAPPSLTVASLTAVAPPSLTVAPPTAVAPPSLTVASLTAELTQPIIISRRCLFSMNKYHIVTSS